MTDEIRGCPRLVDLCRGADGLKLLRLRSGTCMELCLRDKTMQISSSLPLQGRCQPKNEAAGPKGSLYAKALRRDQSGLLAVMRPCEDDRPSMP